MPLKSESDERVCLKQNEGRAPNWAVVFMTRAN
jgi:hypothetical protein